MKLVLPNGSLVIGPTKADVKKALIDIQNVNQDQSIILEQGEMDYLQSRYSNGNYVLFYRSGSSENHFRSKSSLNIDTVLKVFERYFQGDLLWINEIELERILTAKPFIFRLGYFAGSIITKIQKYFKQK
jgi:hypothetical protein